MEQLAKQWTPERVADFLKKIGMGRYAGKFLDEELDGPFLLEAGRESFQELGMKSVLDWVRIAVLYRRELQGGDSEEPQRALLELLKSDKKLSAYVNKFQRSGVDADMILYASKTGCQDQLLGELGISKAVHRSKLMAAIKTHYSSTLASLVTSTLTL